MQKVRNITFTLENYQRTKRNYRNQILVRAVTKNSSFLFLFRDVFLYNQSLKLTLIVAKILITKIN
jgi:hypothetical protein